VHRTRRILRATNHKSTQGNKMQSKEKPREAFTSEESLNSEIKALAQSIMTGIAQKTEQQKKNVQVTDIGALLFSNSNILKISSSLKHDENK
jgi:hypothetical protein